MKLLGLTLFLAAAAYGVWAALTFKKPFKADYWLMVLAIIVSIYILTL